MSKEEKEKLILKFIYIILNKNINRYCSTYFGNIEEGKTIVLNDCIKYIESKYLELEKEIPEEK